MPRQLAILVMVAVGVMASETTWAGQEPESLGERARQARRSPVGVRTNNRSRGGTYYSDRQGSRMWTRVDRIRGLSPLRQSRDGLLPDAPHLRDPIQQIIERRNLLRSRSPLARNAMEMVGRTSLSRGGWLGEAGGPGGSGLLTAQPADVSIPTTTSAPAEEEGPFGRKIQRTGSDVLAARLEAKGEESFRLGVAYFRSGDFYAARQQFELARDVWPDRPRVYLACMFASNQVGEPNRGFRELLRAVELAKSLDDLRIEGFPEQFWPGEDEAAAKEAYRRVAEAINLSVRTGGGGELGRLLVAYYAWLNDDRNTALSAAETALGAAAEPYDVPIRRFRDWLTEEQTPAAATAPAAR